MDYSAHYPESTSLVNLPALKRAYEILQVGVSVHVLLYCSAPLLAHIADSQANDDNDEGDSTEISPEAHFSVIDAFDMPAVRFDSVRGGFTT